MKAIVLLVKACREKVLTYLITRRENIFFSQEFNDIISTGSNHAITLRFYF